MGWCKTHAQQLSVLKPMECEMMSFVGEALTELRKEVGNKSAVLGFIGSPWTLATYIVEGKSSRIYKNIKTMMYSDVRSFFLLVCCLCVSTCAVAEVVLLRCSAGPHVPWLREHMNEQHRTWGSWLSTTCACLMRTVIAV